MSASLPRCSALTLSMALSLSGCALPLRPDAPRIVGPVTLAAGQIYDDCVDLEPGDRVDFRFESTPALAFNISFRSGGAVIEQLVRQPTDSDSGFFVASEKNRYCFSWVAAADAPAPTLLRYRLTLRGRSAKPL